MGQKYKIGKIEGTNVATGDNASVNVATELSPMQVEALQELRKFIALLPAYEIDVSNEVQADATAAEVVLSEKPVDRGRIQNLITRLTVGVAGVAALANAIDAVQAAVARLFT